MADILSGAIACIGFSWIASPACTELEMVTLDWLGNMLELPREFLFQSGGDGGGVIQGTASEATLVAVLSARARAVREHREDENCVLSRLVCYGSRQAHSSVERAGMLAGVKMRLLEPDPELSLTGQILARAVEEDRAAGLLPFCCVATLGTTNTCAFDHLPSLGSVCRDQVQKRGGAYTNTNHIYPGSLAPRRRGLRWQLLHLSRVPASPQRCGAR